MKYLFLILILCNWTTNISAQKIYSFDDKNYHYQVSIDSTLTFDNVGYNYLDSDISIYKVIDNSFVQSITPHENSFFCSLPPQVVCEVVDVNFDGYSGFRLIQFNPTGPNVPYYYWTYDTLAKHFIRDTTFEVITSPTFHPKEKTITSSWRDGCCNYGKSTYKYLHEKLTLIEEEETNVDKKNQSIQINTLKKLVDGKMKLICKTIEKI